MCCRVVRFISTPEILERFVRIEREIVQIEGSIRSNELLATDAAVNSGEGMLFRSTFVCNFIPHSLLGVILSYNLKILVGDTTFGKHPYFHLMIIISYKIMNYQPNVQIHAIFCDMMISFSLSLSPSLFIVGSLSAANDVTKGSPDSSKVVYHLNSIDGPKFN